MEGRRIKGAGRIVRPAILASPPGGVLSLRPAPGEAAPPARGCHPRDDQGGPIQVLLARTECRLAATLDARCRDLMGELHLLQSMVDRQAVSYFLHTPEVPAELQVTAVASANRRYRNWRRTVQRLVRSGTTNGDSAIQLSFDIGAEA